ncbi:MAG: queuosine precursor transporter, partial [Anaerolineales bacterium]|nr:queuosine precursor transporter [Anaerolineales bacterium]
PVWRIVLASIIAEVISELADTEVYRLWIEHVTHRRQWARVLVSNSVSVPLDSLIFVLVAFAGTMPGAVLAEIVLANVAIKAVATLVSLPWIYLVPESGEEREGLPSGAV